MQVYIHMHVRMGLLSLLSACILNRPGQGAPGTHLSLSAGIISTCQQMWILVCWGLNLDPHSCTASSLLMSLSFPHPFWALCHSGLFISGTSVFWEISNHLSSWVLCLLCFISVYWFNSDFTGTYVAIVQEGVSGREVGLRRWYVIKYFSIFSWRLLHLACIGFQAGDCFPTMLEGIFCSPSKSVLTLLNLRPSEVPGTCRPKVLGTSVVSYFWGPPKQ